MYEFDRVEASTREEERAVIREAITSPAPEIIPRQRPGARRLWRPSSLVVTCERERKGGEPWGAWRITSLIVYGPNVKADGAEGAERFTRWWDLPDAHPASRRARAIVEELEAGGLVGATMPTLDTIDENHPE